MKRIVTIFIVALLITSTGCMKKKAEITFKNIEHDFGIIKQGEKCMFKFEFKNTGRNSLKISKVEASCFCTTPEWPHKAIGTNDTGHIKVEYNSMILGKFDKSVLVNTNAGESPVELKIKGVVVVENDTLKK